MAKHPPNAACPCCSGRKYKKCCRPLHLGQPPASAEALMRSRYAAYAVGLVDYIIDTTHPASPHASADRGAWRADISHFVTTTGFERLDVSAHEPGDAQAHVTFTAHLRQGGRPVEMTERSRFLKVDGRWRYLTAVPTG